MMHAEEEHGSSDPPRGGKLLLALCVLCAALFAADLIYHKHVHFACEEWLGFYCGFGVAACLGLVLPALGIRQGLRREEDYYDS
ncbi:MAG: hypothetical protein GTO03_05870 [Planctomycetales bacterium]|nr:hypothetical protein [Planctomycetales bacterium]